MSRPDSVTQGPLTAASAAASAAPVIAVFGMSYANSLLNPELFASLDPKNYPTYGMLAAMFAGTGISAIAGLMQKNLPLIHAVSNLLLLGGTAIMAMGDVAQLQKSDAAKVLAVGLTLFLYSTASVFYHALRAMNVVSEAPKLEVSFTAGGAAGALFFAMGNAMNLYAAHQKGDHNKMAAAGIFDGASALFMYTMIYATVMKLQSMRANSASVMSISDAPSSNASVVVSSGQVEDSERPLLPEETEEGRHSQAALRGSRHSFIGSREPTPRAAADTTVVDVYQDPAKEGGHHDPLLQPAATPRR